MCDFRFLRRMNDFSLSCQLKVQASKRRITKVEVVIFVPFFPLSNLSPSLTSEEVRRSSPTLCPVFFHTGLKSASSQIRIDSFVLFCKLKISYSFDADRNRCPLQSVELLEAEPEQASFLLFLFFFFFISQILKKKAREIH